MKNHKAYLLGTGTCLASLCAFWWHANAPSLPSNSRLDERPREAAEVLTSSRLPNRQLPPVLRDSYHKTSPSAASSPISKASPQPTQAPSVRIRNASVDFAAAPAWSAPKGQVAPPLAASEIFSSPTTSIPETASTYDTGEALAPLTVPFSLLDPTGPANIPAVLAGPTSSVEPSLTLPPGLEQMEQEFLSTVAHGRQDPQDPEYQKAWEEAQTMSDIRMKTAYGDSLWLIRHREAYRQALGNSQPSHP